MVLIISFSEAIASVIFSRAATREVGMILGLAAKGLKRRVRRDAEGVYRLGFAQHSAAGFCVKSFLARGLLFEIERRNCWAELCRAESGLRGFVLWRKG
jgi:hypothetical protein